MQLPLFDIADFVHHYYKGRKKIMFAVASEVKVHLLMWKLVEPLCSDLRIFLNITCKT